MGGYGCGKTEAIIRVAEKILKDSKRSDKLLFIIDFENMRKSGTPGCDQVAIFTCKAIVSQLSRQLTPISIFRLLESNVPDFALRFRDFAESKPLWGHFAKTARSSEELWSKIFPTSSAVEAALPSLRIASNVSEELTLWLSVLKRSNQKVSFAFLHTERLPWNVLIGEESDSILNCFNTRDFNLLFECNDSLKTVWTLCQSDLDFTIVEVPDLPKVAVEAVFVPSLLSDEVHVDTVHALCGGRVGLLQKLVAPLNMLNEEQRIQDEEQEQRYRSGKENRPSTESRELQVSPLVYKREVALRESLITGALQPDVDSFESAMNRVVNEFPLLVDMKSELSDAEFKVLVCESVRQITATLSKSGCMPLPAGTSPLEIAHPVILALLDAHMLMVSWLPAPRLVSESPLKLFLLETWCAAEMDSMTLAQRTQYNIALMRNKLNIQKQLEKLVA